MWDEWIHCLLSNENDCMTSKLIVLNSIDVLYIIFSQDLWTFYPNSYQVIEIRLAIRSHFLLGLRLFTKLQSSLKLSTEYRFTRDPIFTARHVLCGVFFRNRSSRNWIWGRGAWTRLIWLRIGTGGWMLWMRWWRFALHKIRGISWLAEDLLASQEGPCSME